MPKASFCHCSMPNTAKIRLTDSGGSIDLSLCSIRDTALRRLRSEKETDLVRLHGSVGAPNQAAGPSGEVLS